MIDRTAAQNQPGMTRRSFFHKAMAAASVVAGAEFLTGFPLVWAQRLKNITLLQVGGSYSAIIDIARQATKELGFKIEMQNAATDALVNRVATQPKSLDIADMEYWMIRKLLQRQVLQGIDLQRVTYWDKVVPVLTRGEYPDGRTVSQQGTSPYEVQYLEKSNSTALAKGPTRWATLIPTLYNADTLGIRPDLINRPIAH